jgi:hypothetical protein
MKTLALIVALAIPATPALAGHCHSGKCAHRPVVKRALRCVRRRHRQCCVRAVCRKECCAPSCCTDCGCVEEMLSTPEGREELHKLIHQSAPCEGKDCP